MKRIRLLAALVLCLAFVRPARGETIVALNAVTATGASSVTDTFGHRLLRAQVWSAAGATATVTIESRSSSTAPWFVVATITNPSTVGEYWAVPRCYQARLNVTSYANGTITGTIERYNN